VQSSSLTRSAHPAARSGDGGHALALSAPGVNVGGATVTVTLSGTEDFKGLLLFAEVDGRPAGAWGADLPEGVQPHPHCKLTVTHDTYHVGGKQRDAIPWIVPDGLSEGTSVVFKATIVRDYATWCAQSRARHTPPAALAADCGRVSPARTRSAQVCI
jgi:hypothetical protein